MSNNQNMTVSRQPKDEVMLRRYLRKAFSAPRTKCPDPDLPW